MPHSTLGLCSGRAAGKQRRGPSEAAFFVENVLELLDAPGEWFHDRVNRKLYLYPNSTLPVAGETFVGAELKTLFRLQGSQSAPVRDVALKGLTLRHTSADFLERYEVPGGGDQSVPRCGAVFIEGAEHVVVENCTFDALDGSGVYFQVQPQCIHCRQYVC